MFNQQFEFLDVLSIVSFALQMEYFSRQQCQPELSDIAAKLDSIEHKLDQLLKTVA